MKRRTILALVAWLLCLGSLAAWSAPALVVEHIALQPQDPISGDPVAITATLRNVGRTDADERFYVRFTIDGIDLETLVVPSGLDAGRQTEVTTSWIASPGPHVIGVEVDQPFDRVDEEDEGNNFAPIELFIPFSPDSAARLESLRVVVAHFQDVSGSGFVNAAEGIALKVSDGLAQAGVRVLGTGELATIMQERGLNPDFHGDVALAAREMGADVIVLGSIDALSLYQSSLDLGFVRFDGAAADVALSARLIDVHSSEILSALTVEGHDEGSTGFSVDVGSILGLSEDLHICNGGLRTQKDWYYTGNTIPIGYLNPSPASWYSLEIHTSGNDFVRWLGWQYVGAGACGTWNWDQRDAYGNQMSPGIYTAKLWEGSSYVAATTIQIRPGFGVSIPLVDEITVGSETFDDTIVGSAVNQAVTQLTTLLLHSLEDVAGFAMETAPGAPRAFGAVESADEPGPLFHPLEGQVAAILPNDRIAINIGAMSGVTKGDFFEVVEAENVVTDPQTLEILSYDIVAFKGEIVIVEVRDRVAYGVRTMEFEPAVGDIVRLLAP